MAWRRRKNGVYGELKGTNGYQEDLKLKDVLYYCMEGAFMIDGCKAKCGARYDTNEGLTLQSSPA
jgi:hypothetical protein